MNPLEKPFDIITNKTLAIIQNAFIKHSPPNMKLNNVTELDLELLKKLKNEYNIRALIVDVDETLRTNSKSIPKCNKKWLEYMKKEFQICVISKGYDEKVKHFFEQMNIKYSGFHLISKRKSFKEATKEMGLKPENVLVIGDDAISDIYAGNKCGMLTAIVEQVIEEEEDLER